MSDIRPCSAACERNKAPILEVLKTIITSDDKYLLEIGSGTGQHAVYFAPHFPHLHWVTSDLLENHNGIKSWLNEYKISSIKGPLLFEVGKDDFPRKRFDLVFQANILHIMSWKQGKTLIKLLGRYLKEGAQAIFYGPFNYNGQFSSSSNEQFDQSLKERDPKSGIRSFENIDDNMKKNGFSLFQDFEMPANNRLLVFTKIHLNILSK